MHFTRPSFLRHGFLIALLGLVFLVMPRQSRAADDDHVNVGLNTAKAWLNQIDNGLYEESYAAGCVAFRQKVARDRWTLVLQTLRPQFGTLVSRKQISHLLKPDGYEGLDGECMVIMYETSFSKLDPAREVVIMKWEDGRWRGAGYNVGPKPLAPGEEPDNPINLPQTETSSSTIKPQPTAPPIVQPTRPTTPR